MTFRGIQRSEWASAKNALLARASSPVNLCLDGEDIEKIGSKYSPPDNPRATLKPREGPILDIGDSRYVFFDRDERKPLVDEVCLLNWVQDGLIIAKDFCGQDGPFVLQAYLSSEGLEPTCLASNYAGLPSRRKES